MRGFDKTIISQGNNIQVKLPESETEQSRDKLGKLAGVSGSTYEHASKVIDNAPTPIVNATRNNEISINTAGKITRYSRLAEDTIRNLAQIL